MKQNNLSLWIRGARLRTLGAAIVPVFVGGGIALSATAYSGFAWGRLGLALAVALSLQIAVNFANDYSDGKRGVDSSEVRQGPIRLVGSGLKTPKAVLGAALLFFLLAMVCGFFLAVLAGYELLIAGTIAMVAAWTYTGGPFPYGYKALGEVSVFIFFGLLATLGTTYALINELPLAGWLGGAGVGALSSAILIANNYRDIEGDELMGKRTLAVLLGARQTQYLYLLMFLTAGVLAVAQMFQKVWTGFSLVGLFLPNIIIGIIILQSSYKKSAPGKKSQVAHRGLFAPNLGRAVLALYGYGLGLGLAYWI